MHRLLAIALLPWMLSGSPIVAPGIFTTELEMTKPPKGFLDFCEREPAQCEPITGVPRSEEEQWDDLSDVNRAVNAEITPMTDMEIYGVREFWALPLYVGDCEDYALLKRKRLLDRGWPSHSLLIAVAEIDGEELAHAMLIARTPLGDVVLDNRNNYLRVWSKSEYRFLKRQSVDDPKQWVSLR